MFPSSLEHPKKYLLIHSNQLGVGVKSKKKVEANASRPPKFQNHKVPIKNLQKSPKILGTGHQYWLMCALNVTTFTLNISTSAKSASLVGNSSTMDLTMFGPDHIFGA
jgi:hypothetical protein